ncbi:MAG: S26 family signal peptidase [Lewinella sp.]|nr:S26 family signal peptidase [Lewinella sp.]
MTWLAWLLLIGYVLLSISLYRVFEKAGEAGWKGLVPGLNFVVWAQLVGRKPWHAVWMLVPLVNIFIYAGLAVDMARSFGKYKFWHSFVAVVATPFLFFYLGYKPEEKYIGAILPREREYAERIEEAREKGNDRRVQKLMQENPYRKSSLREWGEAVIFAVFAAAFIRMFFIEPFVIPTSSMEGSLMVGDFLFVSKVHYGLRTPETVAMLPLLHNREPFFGGESYFEKPSLPYYRFPALEPLDRNDPVVFNIPAGDSIYIFPDRTFTHKEFELNLIKEYNATYDALIRSGRKKLVTRPVDKRDHYVKRCIGVAGDSLQIIDRQVYINGAPAENPENIQFMYQVTLPGTSFNTSRFAEWGISEEDVRPTRNPQVRIITMTNQQKEQLQSLDPNLQIEVVEFSTDPAYGYRPERLFPHDPRHFGPWTVDNFGPIYIPKKGVTVAISPDNIAIYRRIIGVYEDNELEERDGKIFINGEEATEYTFQMNYYWMMGDNRHNSEDSRVWGFVPEDHIVGKPLFIWFSLREGSLRKGINWSRVFTRADNR